MRKIRLLVLAVLAVIPSAAFANGLGAASYEGTGCPQGSVGLSFSNDRTTATLIFDSFVASAGPGVPEAESLKECSITFELTSTEPFAVTSDSRGYVQLATGTTAEHQQHVVQAKQGNTVTSFAGPVAEDYLAHSTRQPQGQSSKLKLHLKVELDGNGSQGMITQDSFDIKLSTP